MTWVDLHSHIVFDVDDGVADLTQSLAVLARLHAMGFAEVCATPHQKAGQYLPDWDTVTARFAHIQAQIAPGSGPILHLGAENMWDDVFHQRYQDLAIPSYNDGAAFLFELSPSLWPPSLLDTVFAARMRGQLPVLAHPERYQFLAGNAALAKQVAAQCAMVLDAAALAGHHGAAAMESSRWLLKIGCAHALASDAHRTLDVDYAQDGIEWVIKKYGAAMANRLLDEAPRAILAGEHPA